MFRTIADCDKALEFVDNKVKLLAMERDHILKVRSFLEEHGEQTYPSTEWKREKVLSVIADNPGINGREVRRLLDGEGYVGRQVQSTIANLSKLGKIENRGGSTVGARWYIKEPNAT